MTFRIECNNDVGYGEDEAFYEWWEVTDDTRTFKCDNEADAKWLLDLLNGQEDLKRNTALKVEIWGAGGGGGGIRPFITDTPTPPHHKKPDKPTA